MRLASILVASLVVVVSGCDNMKRQRSARTDEPAPRLPGGTATQSPPPHVVAHSAQPVASTFAQGEDRPGVLATRAPMPLTVSFIRRGRERYDIYCSVCHAVDGGGRGIVVRRGFPAPPSLHEPRLRDAPIGYFVQVITRGHGLMYPYADRIGPDDRWAVAAYVRALQLSRHADVNTLPDADRERLGKL